MTPGVLLLLARAGDPTIARLRQVLPQHLVHADVCDLSQPGWRCVVGQPQLATAAVHGEVLSADRIAAVLCRIHSVAPRDLALHPEDREFAAAEMQAFLHAWLAQFQGRLCNQPSAASLAGPAWLAMRWRWLAAQAGIPAVTAVSPEESRITVLVAGEQVLGAAPPVLQSYALRMARVVRSHLLAVHFIAQPDWRLESADPLPALDARAAAQLAQWAIAMPHVAPARAMATAS
jgi:hypothetical protein